MWLTGVQRQDRRVISPMPIAAGRRTAWNWNPRSPRPKPGLADNFAISMSKVRLTLWAELSSASVVLFPIENNGGERLSAGDPWRGQADARQRHPALIHRSHASALSRSLSLPWPHGRLKGLPRA